MEYIDTAHCQYEFCREKTYASYKCHGCQNEYCEKHRTPKTHECIAIRRGILHSRNEFEFKQDRRTLSPSSLPQRPSNIVRCQHAGCLKERLTECRGCHQNFCVIHRNEADHICIDRISNSNPQSKRDKSLLLKKPLSTEKTTLLSEKSLPRKDLMADKARLLSFRKSKKKINPQQRKTNIFTSLTTPSVQRSLNKKDGKTIVPTTSPRILSSKKRPRSVFQSSIKKDASQDDLESFAPPFKKIRQDPNLTTLKKVLRSEANRAEQLERKLQEALTITKKYEIDMEESQKLYTSVLSKKNEEMTNLSDRVEKILKEEQNTYKKLQKLQTEYNTAQLEWNDKNMKLSETLTNLQNRYDQMYSEKVAIENNLHLNYNKMEKQNMSLTQQLHTLQEQLQQEKKRNSNLSSNQASTKQELESAMALIENLQRQLEEQKTNVELIAKGEVEAMRAECENKLRTLAADMETLKHQSRKTEAIEEEMDILNKQLEQERAEQNAYIQLSTDYKLLQDKLNRWLDIVREVYPDCSNEYELKLLLQNSSTTQLEDIRARDKLQTLVKTLEKQLAKERRNTEQYTKEVANLTEQLKNVTSELETTSKDLERLRNNDQVYQNFFKSGNRENIDINESVQKILASLQNEKDQLEPQIETLKAERALLQQDIHLLRKSIASLQIEDETLRFCDEPLNKKLPNESNSLALSKENAVLKLELEQYKTRVKEMSVGSAKFQQMESIKLRTILEDRVDNFKKANDALHKKCAELQTKLKSTQQISENKLTKYRDLVHKLTGWSITIIPTENTITQEEMDTLLLNKQIVLELKHIWMTAPSDRLIIESVAKDQFQIRETPFLKNVSNKTLKHFANNKSAPHLLTDIVTQLYKEHEQTDA